MHWSALCCPSLRWGLRARANALSPCGWGMCSQQGGVRGVFAKRAAIARPTRPRCQSVYWIMATGLHRGWAARALQRARWKRLAAQRRSGPGAWKTRAWAGAKTAFALELYKICLSDVHSTRSCDSEQPQKEMMVLDLRVISNQPVISAPSIRVVIPQGNPQRPWSV